jgi:hypothetical protein
MDGQYDMVIKSAPTISLTCVYAINRVKFFLNIKKYLDIANGFLVEKNLTM